MNYNIFYNIFYKTRENIFLQNLLTYNKSIIKRLKLSSIIFMLFVFTSILYASDTDLESLKQQAADLELKGQYLKAYNINKQILEQVRAAKNELKKPVIDSEDKFLEPSEKQTDIEIGDYLHLEAEKIILYTEPDNNADTAGLFFNEVKAVIFDIRGNWILLKIFNHEGWLILKEYEYKIFKE